MSTQVEKVETVVEKVKEKVVEKVKEEKQEKGIVYEDGVEDCGGVMINTKYVKAWCVNLARRPDRWEYMQGVSDPFCDELIRLDAVDTNSRVGCGKSHMKAGYILKEHEAELGDCITVLQDDCTFIEDAKERWLEAVKELPSEEEGGWDLLLGGVHHCRVVAKTSEHLVQVSDFSGLHCGLYHKRIFPLLETWNGRGCFDRFIGKLAMNNKVRIFAVQPMVSKQRADFSDLRHRKVNDKVAFERYEKVLTDFAKRKEIGEKETQSAYAAARNKNRYNNNKNNSNNNNGFNLQKKTKQRAQLQALQGLQTQVHNKDKKQPAVATTVQRLAAANRRKTLQATQAQRRAFFIPEHHKITLARLAAQSKGQVPPPLPSLVKKKTPFRPNSVRACKLCRAQRRGLRLRGEPDKLGLPTECPH